MGESLVKTGWMLGLGESDGGGPNALLDEVAAIGVRLVTIGQYLRPSKRQLPVVEYVAPEVFESYRALRGGPGPAGAVGTVRAQFFPRGGDVRANRRGQRQRGALSGRSLYSMADADLYRPGWSAV